MITYPVGGGYGLVAHQVYRVLPLYSLGGMRGLGITGPCLHGGNSGVGMSECCLVCRFCVSSGVVCHGSQNESVSISPAAAQASGGAASQTFGANRLYGG